MTREQPVAAHRPRDLPLGRLAHLPTGHRCRELGAGLRRERSPLQLGQRDALLRLADQLARPERVRPVDPTPQGVADLGLARLTVPGAPTKAAHRDLRCRSRLTPTPLAGYGPKPKTPILGTLARFPAISCTPAGPKLPVLSAVFEPETWVPLQKSGLRKQGIPPLSRLLSV